MSAYDLVMEAKKVGKISSDNALAKLLGVQRSTISSWKRGISKPDGISTLKLCILANVDGARATEIWKGE
ncbi:MAG: helix-turn-helix domain-containing protein [Methylophilus methylotrophus]|uniref:Helix-turn-helix domain-containing protein n=1 Tax=Methylophilus methylotrophus TaxID=17 RepID=A0A5C7WH22_METME|nr:MAG: helix-turn-helix domain-containing protein [Methylophilus methylotrophus]